MEVKKNGKVEHSDNSHDDQVFSYLMALYVWYDGKNLMENFHIQKNTIKTDADEDIEELDIEDAIESTEKIDVESLSFDPESDLADTYNSIVEQTKLVTSKDLKEQEYLLSNKRRMSILAINKDAREAYCKETGLSEDMFKNEQAATFTTLPDELFMDIDLDLDEEQRDPVLQGNLSDMWNKL